MYFDVQISVATFKLGQVEMVQQSKGLESVIKAQISNVAIEECAAIPWDEFQVTFCFTKFFSFLFFFF